MTFEQYKKNILEKRNEVVFCPICNQRISDRTVSLYKGLIRSLYEVYCYCGKNKKHLFSMSEIKHLLGKNEYARFGDLIRFGGIVYKPAQKAQYGINMQRAKEFFIGERKIPVQIVLNQITNEIIEATYVSVHDFPDLKQLLTVEGLYDPEKRIKINIDWKKQEEVGLPPVKTQRAML